MALTTSNSQALGLDFGTTRTKAYRWDWARNNACDIQLGISTSGGYPTSLHLRRDGGLAFGDEAEELALQQPSGYLRGLNRLLVENRGNSWFHGKQHSHFELATAYLREVRRLTEQRAFRGTPSHCVITVTNPPRSSADGASTLIKSTPRSLFGLPLSVP